MRKFFNNIRVLYKLLILAGGGTVGILIVTYFAFKVLRSEIETSQKLEAAVRVAQMFGNADMMHDAVSSDVFKAFHALKNRPEDLPEIRREFDEHYVSFYEQFWTVWTAVPDSVLSREMSAAHAKINSYLECGRYLINNTNADSATIALKMQEFNRLYYELEDELGVLGNHINSHPAKEITRIIANANSDAATIATVVGVALLLGVYLSFVITRSFTSAFDKLKALSGDMSGQWTEPEKIVIDRTDELGEVLTMLKERRELAEAIRVQERHAREHSQALYSLTTNKAVGGGRFDDAVRVILETAAEVINVDRVSVWLLDESGSTLRLVDLYERCNNIHSTGIVLLETDYPAYFEALMRDRIISAVNAQNDPRLSEFSVNYLKPLGISSVLDTPVYLRGEFAGIVSYEHIGEPTFWTIGQERFASSVSDLVATALESDERRRAEEKARALTSFQTAILDSAGYGIIATTTEGVITAFNRAAQQMLGYKASEMINTLTPAVFHDLGEVVARAKEFSADLGMDIVPGFEVFVAKARLNLHNEYEWTYIRKDVSRFPVLVTVTALRNHHGDITGFLGIAADITERKRAEEELERTLRELDFQKYALDQHAIVGITDTQGTIIYANAKFSEISQFRNDELLGQNHRILNAGYHGKDFFRNLWGTIASGRVWHGEIRNRRKDGGFYWVDTTIVPLLGETNRPFRYIAIRTDISVRKQAEYELIQAKQTADEANRAKSEFLANMSHEIRTPMNAVLGFSELLKNRITDGKSKGYVEGILTSGKALLSLINDILDLSKIEAGKLELQPEPTDPYALCREVAQVFMFRAEEKGLTLDVTVDAAMPRSLILDEIRVRQILLNLIGNAIKFTERGTVGISAGCQEFQGDASKINLTFAVSDTGIGIPKEQQDRIFEAFIQQEGQRTRKYGGTGLGLSITKRLIDMMGGAVAVESTPGQGTIFTVMLPGVALSSVAAAGSAGENAAADTDENIHFTGGTVLVVEDIAANREVFREFMFGHDITIIEAENGLEGVSKAAEYLPDIIFMDIHMPVMDGYEAFDGIRANQATSHIPVVALTASVLSEESKRISKIFNGYLRKPAPRSEIFAELKKYLPFVAAGMHAAAHTEQQDAPRNLTPEQRSLCASLLPAWDEIRGMMSIDDIEKFARTANALGEEHDIEPLRLYADALLTAADNIEIERLNMLFSAFKDKFG